ncbi:LacI family DNA-binding transcriptional regulator [Terrilactibacillus sp. BCM23-1]|uniref:LacI family DNA-binding transcriptional regulator n=1 Tax=Terrilactibacillus tamarindi TaxID=2599694 RepID=A0A6N8CT27_9BACI|nr:LacI family DNA-binding transcriptional regulator [Terrilactibacillus tamarindi]MTT33319.1 LacI family DNA-binding transcriptional regulator [Terrilactibacillus tamarindi]
MKPNIKDIARHAGVSPTTVSRVLNNRGYLSQKTKDKVHQAMKDLNYFPNELARSLFKQKTNLIGLIFPTTSNPFFGELIFHIENSFSSKGYKVLLCNSLNRVDKEMAYLDMLQRNQVDGIVVGAHNRHIRQYESMHLPVVAIDRNLSDSIPVVSSDNYLGGKIATEHLLNKGCQKIIHINGPHELETPANKRREAYEEVMMKEDRSPITYELRESLNKNYTKTVINQLFDEHPDVDGIFASDDLIAAAVISEAKKRGMNIPKELKIIGYDGTESVKTCLPELTTIQQPIQAIAQSAVNVLIQQMGGEKSIENIVLPIQLIKGFTT